MPNPTLTLLDVQLRNPGSATIDRRIVDDVIEASPLIARMPARTIPGTTYEYLRRTSIPKPGFRPANAGVNVHKTSYEQHVDKCYILNDLVWVDNAVADSDPRGKGELLAEEARDHVRAALFAIEQQCFYGKKIDPNGFAGFADCIGDYMTLSANPANNTGGGTLPEGGASVWALHLKPEAIEMLYGSSQGIAFGKPGEQVITADNGKPMVVTYMEMLARVGLTVKSQFALGHIGNESKDHPLTDNMLADLVNSFPDSKRPTLIIMPRSTRARLQKSRAAALTYQKKASGQTTSAETPTEYEGIPIITTEALLDDETAENIAAAADAALEAKKNLNNLLR